MYISPTKNTTVPHLNDKYSFPTTLYAPSKYEASRRVVGVHIMHIQPSTYICMYVHTGQCSLVFFYVTISYLLILPDHQFAHYMTNFEEENIYSYHFLEVLEAPKLENDPTCSMYVSNLLQSPAHGIPMSLLI